MPIEKENPDAIIIGGGPAAMSSALYLLRAGKKVLLLEREGFGGQIAKSPRLENYPTIKVISGIEWTDKVFEQIQNLGAEFEFEEAEAITKEGDTFTVKTNYNEYQAKAVIIAAGVNPRKLNAPNEDKLLGHGISYCAVCDGDFFTGKDVCLIGDANTALQYAMLLASKCRHVQIATLFDHFFADNILVEAMKKIPKPQIFNLRHQKIYASYTLFYFTFYLFYIRDIRIVSESNFYGNIITIPKQRRNTCIY